jgi:hypothetical protein
VGHLRIELALALALASIVAAPRGVAAQTAAGGDDRPTVHVGFEARRDRLTYRFDNPSNFDTTALVPHFFEQTYVADNVWLTATARYTAGVRWETEGAVTPQRSSAATDYDTFFDPDGSVVVSGTSGNAAMRALRVSQMAEVGRIGRATLVSGYRFRLDTADFGVGHKTVIRDGTLLQATDVTTRESTSSQIHELVMAVSLPMTVSPRWMLNARGELAPAVFGRLAVELHDKYPGQDLVFIAKAAATSVRLTLAQTGTRWPIEITADASRTWSYRSTAQLASSVVGLGVKIGRSW